MGMLCRLFLIMTGRKVSLITACFCLTNRRLYYMYLYWVNLSGVLCPRHIGGSSVSISAFSFISRLSIGWHRERKRRVHSFFIRKMNHRVRVI